MASQDDLSDMVEDNLEKKGSKNSNTAELDARVRQWIVADYLSELVQMFEEFRRCGKEDGGFALSLYVDPILLLNYDEEIGHLLFRDIQKLHRSVQRVCFSIFKIKGETTSETIPLEFTEQLRISLRLTYYPSINLHAIPMRTVHVRAGKGKNELFSVKGIITRVSSPRSVLHCCVFTCMEMFCKQKSTVCKRGGKKSTYVTESCQGCGSSLEEDGSRSSCMKTQEITLSEVEERNNWPSVARQSIAVVLLDDLIPNPPHVILGLSVCVVGTLRLIGGCEPFTNRWVIEANNVLIDTPSSETENTNNEVGEAVSFSMNLTFITGLQLVPPMALTKLKLMLLLSIVSSVEADGYDNRIHLLVTGDPNAQIQRLLRYGTSLVQRNSIFSATFKGNTLGPFVSKKDGAISLDAGILLSGNGGVTHIPELTAIRKKELNFLEQAMEKPDVALEENLQVTCTTSVIAFASRKMFSSEKKAPNQSPANLWSRFQLMYKIPENLSQDEERMFVSHLLSFHSSETPTAEPFEYLRQVIHEARNSTATVSNIAGQLLQRYWLANRKIRNPSEIPLQLADTLKRLAIAHAKLVGHPEATEEDALVAIHMAEESLVARSGSSLLGFSCDRQNNLATFSVSDVRDQYREFGRHVRRTLDVQVPVIDLN